MSSLTLVARWRRRKVACTRHSTDTSKMVTTKPVCLFFVFLHLDVSDVIFDRLQFQECQFSFSLKIIKLNIFD